jgi:uncharacterized lipoprotein YehR (DUF1307 family)
MKIRYFISIIIAVTIVIVFNSCDDKNEGAKFAGDFVSFDSNGITTTVSDNNKIFTVMVYHKNLNKSDSKVKLNLKKSANLTDAMFTIDKTEFDFSNTDSVPVTISIDPAKLTDCETYQIDLEIDSLSATKVSPYDGEPLFSLYFNKLLNYVAGDFAGSFNLNSAFFGDKWDVTAITDGNNIIIKDMYEAGYDITLTVDPSTLSINVAEQSAWVHATYGLAKVKGSGIVSICDKTITLKLEHTVSAGSFGEETEVLTLK